MFHVTKLNLHLIKDHNVVLAIGSIYVILNLACTSSTSATRSFLTPTPNLFALPSVHLARRKKESQQISLCTNPPPKSFAQKRSIPLRIFGFAHYRANFN